MVRHPLTRKYRPTRPFVFTLGYSRKSVRLLTFESSTQRWAELHEETFRRLGSAVRRGPGQLARGRAHPRPLRPDAESALLRRARPLRRRRPAVSGPVRRRRWWACYRTATTPRRTWTNEPDHRP